MNCPSCGHSVDYHRWKDSTMDGLHRFKSCALAHLDEAPDSSAYGMYVECCCTEFSHAGEASRAMVRELGNKAKLLRSLPVLEAISTERPLGF